MVESGAEDRMAKVWIEVALNGAWSRRLQPGIPDTLDRESHGRHALDFAVPGGLHPAFAIYEPGFTRAGAALARAAKVKPPLYRFMFSDGFAFGFPARPYALAAHLALLEEAAPAAP